MSRLSEVRAMAEAFWQRAGEVELFPRTMQAAIMRALPVAIVLLPRLHLSNVERWLRERRVPFRFPCADRRVHGCVVAYRGLGVIFADGTDGPGELRLTLAHEAAHFLVDYLQPREEALARLGPAFADVLDGRREPTTQERVHAVLNHVHVGVYHNLIERRADGQPTLSAIWDAEDRADRLALELIAPAQAVLAQVDLSLPHYSQRHAAVVRCLTATFGLPEDMADWYGRMLLRSVGKGPSWLEQLGLRARRD